MITFDDFQKLDIRIGKIISAERVPETDKLVKLVFDFGAEQMQIIAGIAVAVLDTNDLIGKEMPVIVNLEPRTICGLLSQGMILAADNEGMPVLLHPAQEVPPGSSVK